MSNHDFSEPIPPSELHGLDPGELLARGLETGNPSGGASPWEPPTPEELGRLLPEYRIANLIGRGGMGAVYKGTQIALDRPVAIKLLPPEIAADGEFVARIFDETRALAKLQHSRIIVVHDFGQTSDGHLCIVMDYVEGTDLRQILQGPGLSPDEALHVVGQICDALHAAHSQGVIHGGIKPENILITGEGYVKVVDFGLARPLNQEAMIAPLVAGEPATAADYLAPEQREGQAGERSDIFALGVVFYEMLAGAPPRGAFELPSSRIRGTPMDARVDGIVSMALQPDPDRRYQRVSEMKYDVDRIRKKPLPDAAPPAVPTPPVPLKKRRVIFASLAAVLGLLIAIAAFVVWVKGGRLGSSRSNSGNARETIRPANSVSGPKVIGHDSPIAQATPSTPKRGSSPAGATASARTTPSKVTPSFALNAAPGRQEISLFNGRDLTGWAGDPGVWSVEDGAITGRSKPGALIPEYSNLVWKGGLVSDFEITWKYKIMSTSSGQTGSCGMFFRAMVINDSLFVRGYFADLWADREMTGGLRDEFRWKDLAGQNQQVIIQDGAEPGQPVIIEVGQAGNSRELRDGIKENGWNECKAVVSGNGIQLFVNGRMTVDAVDMGALAPRWGTFALARRPPAAAQFKDIRLRDMGSTPRNVHARGVAGEKNSSPREPSALERAALEDCLTFYKWRCAYTSVPDGDPIQITFDRNGTATSQHFRCPWKITASRTVMISPNNMPVSLEFDESLSHFKGYLAGKDLRYRGEQLLSGDFSNSGERISPPSKPAPPVVTSTPQPVVGNEALTTVLLSHPWSWNATDPESFPWTKIVFWSDGTVTTSTTTTGRWTIAGSRSVALQFIGGGGRILLSLNSNMNYYTGRRDDGKLVASGGINSSPGTSSGATFSQAATPFPSVSRQATTAASPSSFDPIQPNSVWRGDGNRVLTILERQGETFRGRYTHKKVVREMTGSVKGDQISWMAKDVRAIKGRPGGDNFGTIRGNTIDFKWSDYNGPSGSYTLTRDLSADPQPDGAGEARVSVSGVGPGGTNAGWGNARLPMHAIVSTNASTSVNLRVDCYWVVVNGSHHSIVPVAASFDRNIRCAPGEQTHIDFEDDTSFHRNNATKDGVDNPAGLFRGWVISVHDSNGKKAGWAANIPEFEHLAP